MLGLAILFGLLVWIVVTLIAMTIGYKIAKKKGLFAGFMLTMGGWIVYWAIEFAYIQAKVSYLCKKEAGITVYITPEQWRKQIREEEWKKLKPFTDTEIDKRYAINNNNTLLFNNKKYKYTRGQIRAGNIENGRILYYDFYDKVDGVHMASHILVDKITQNVLLKKIEFSYSKSFMGINLSFIECSSNISEKFHEIAVQYSNRN
ncbi:hypothetical protein LNQ82_05630 [Conchiformibius steedae DSM 2580]|uniref:Uncharacterized protein n=1 Tax=Conchiformibius steedae DSM 2580 TaxID=1121352 RepID=A0AAE9HV16_9NEIS|nr:hypothetical protein [Conchiformibius steedae]QMT33951.1 hypothetical protein H3L98_02705 [Conchiformibius steedae]URD66720.1 hypothetical protein LNQ82_05630 [Conchiformibius steedae DSM 2580]